ncbi:hypothetical protein CDD83_1195 [Cordyceps sp. RAO-2017]|nr:hypothetical protein CDD83_1195 [Cordyceps sp. RAO-2017]
METALAPIRALAQTADAAGRLALLRALRQVQTELQSPTDTLMEIVNQAPLLASLRLGIDLGLFRTLADRGSVMSLAQLAESCGASPQLLERFLRYYAANDVVEEVDVRQYKATSLTRVVADPKGTAMISHIFDTHAPTFQAMPGFFAEKGYREIGSSTETPFQKAFKTDLGAFDWMARHPEQRESLQTVMTTLEGSAWADGLAVLEDAVQAAPAAGGRTFLVDVGGGRGHQCVQLGRKFPSLLGRLVVQDLPEVVDGLPATDGVRAEAHDFFDEQPVAGASFYYLRRVLHDWPDGDCVRILDRIAGAMAADSRILVDEVVLPDRGAPCQAAMADLAMMVAMGGKERTEQQWRALAESSGLRVDEIHTYMASTCTSVVVLARK